MPLSLIFSLIQSIQFAKVVRLEMKARSFDSSVLRSSIRRHKLSAETRKLINMCLRLKVRVRATKSRRRSKPERNQWTRLCTNSWRLPPRQVVAPPSSEGPRCCKCFRPLGARFQSQVLILPRRFSTWSCICHVSSRTALNVENSERNLLHLVLNIPIKIIRSASTSVQGGPDFRLIADPVMHWVFECGPK